MSSLLCNFPKFYATQEVATSLIIASRLRPAMVPMPLPMNGSSYPFLGFLIPCLDILSISQVISGSNLR